MLDQIWIKLKTVQQLMQNHSSIHRYWETLRLMGSHRLMNMNGTNESLLVWAT